MREKAGNQQFEYESALHAHMMVLPAKGTEGLGPKPSNVLEKSGAGHATAGDPAEISGVTVGCVVEERFRARG